MPALGEIGRYKSRPHCIQPGLRRVAHALEITRVSQSNQRLGGMPMEPALDGIFSDSSGQLSRDHCSVAGKRLDEDPVNLALGLGRFNGLLSFLDSFVEGGVGLGDGHPIRRGTGPVTCHVLSSSDFEEVDGGSLIDFSEHQHACEVILKPGELRQVPHQLVVVEIRQIRRELG
jgi:hypothetical protein